MYTNLQQILFTEIQFWFDCCEVYNFSGNVEFYYYASTKCRYLITGNLIQEFKITCRSIHVYTYYTIQWVPFNLIAAKQIFWIYST